MSFMPHSADFNDAPDETILAIDPDTRRDVARAARAMAFLVFGLGAAAAFLPIGGAVVGAGQLVAETQIKHIANPLPSTAIVAKTFVRDGDHVNAGDPLVQLDATNSSLEERFASRTVHQLLAQRARLEAERLGSPQIAFPDELKRSPDQAAAQAMADESQLFRLRQAEMRGMRAQLAAQVEQNLRQEQGLRAQISSLKSQRELLEPERAGMENLWKRGLVTISRKNQLERQMLETQGSIGSLQAQIAQTRARNREVSEQLQQLGRVKIAQAAGDLAAVDMALNEQRLRSSTSAKQVERSVVRAPNSGVVDKLAITAVGDVVSPAQPMLEIVPDKDRLMVEVAISPADIDRIRLGKTARVQVAAGSGNAKPEMKGKVEYVSASRSTDASKQTSFFIVRVSIDPQTVPSSARSALRPGSPADVFIETGSRSMLSYLTRPLRDQFARAFARD